MTTEDRGFTERVLAAQRGDPGAVETLLTENWAWVQALIAGIVRNRADVDDVHQNVCVKVIRKIGTLRSPESFRAWLACLTRREALRWRNQSRRAGLSLDHEAAAEPYDPDARSVDERLAEEEERRLLLEAIERLPRKYREVLVLQHSGRSYKDIAEILDLTLTTVQIRLVRARKMILEAIRHREKRGRMRA